MRFGKVVCDPTSEEAKNLIGKKVATDGICSKLMERPEECGVGILKGTAIYNTVYHEGHYIDVYCNAPFLMENMDGYCYCTIFLREIIEEEEL